MIPTKTLRARMLEADRMEEWITLTLRRGLYQPPPKVPGARAAFLAFLAIWLAILALLFVVAFTLPRPAIGHEAVMPDGSSVDYTNLRNPITGRLCCNKKDCKPVPWKETEDGLVLYELVPGSGEFRRPPENTEMQPIDGNAHVCSNTSQILCVVMPGIGS